jgi:HPt (histidine-containing phosphotransfer) domain-containing protein
MDCQMPEMDGYEATRLIREYESKNIISKRSYIVALTAGDSGSDRSRARNSGMDDFMQKPFDISTIREALRSAARFAEAERIFPHENSSSLRQLSFSLDSKAPPPLDTDVVRRLVALAEETNAPSLLSSLLQGFNDQFERCLVDLESAAAEKDRDAIRSISHGLKSMSANIGAAELRSIAERMEKSEAHRPTYDARTIQGALTAAHARFSAEFSKLVTDNAYP